ncbi:LGFP repeat-containing protein, partial [Flindersiella endophytica]
MSEIHKLFPNAGALLTPHSHAELRITEKYARLNGAPGAKVGGLEPSRAGAGGFFQRYESSAIYWRQDVGTCWVLGAIYRRYLELGDELSYLGFPATDETDWTDPDTQQPGRISHFEQ